MSFTNSATRIENITDWEAITKKYRALTGEAIDDQNNEDGGDMTGSQVNEENPGGGGGS